MVDESKIRPLNGFVLLRFPKEAESVQQGGIVLPGQAVSQRVWRIATVVSLDERGIPNKSGSGFHPHEVKVGDQVVIDKIFGDRVVDGKITTHGLRVVSEDQITAIIANADGSEVPGDLVLDPNLV